MAGEQQRGKFGGERSRRCVVRAVGRISLKTAVPGIRDDVACRAEQSFDLAPMLVGVDAGADAAYLDRVVDDGAAGKALDKNTVRLAARKSRQALAAALVPRRLHDGDGTGCARRHRFTDEQVGMRLQE